MPAWHDTHSVLTAPTLLCAETPWLLQMGPEPPLPWAEGGCGAGPLSRTSLLQGLPCSGLQHLDTTISHQHWSKSQSPSTSAWCPMAPQDPHLVEVVGIRAWLLPHPHASVSPTTLLPFPCSSTCPNSPQSQPAWHMDPTTHSHPLHNPNNLTPAPHLPPGLLGCPWPSAGLCGTPLWGSAPSAPLQLKPSPSSIPWAPGWRVAVPVSSPSLCHLTVEESSSKVVGCQGLGVQTWGCQHGPMVPLRRTRDSLGADSRQSAASNPGDPVPTVMSP